MTETATALPSLAPALRGYSIEVSPSQPNIIEAALDRLPRATEVFLPWIPGANPFDVVRPAARLRRGGLLPVPHIGARHLEGRSQLEQLAQRFAGDAGVDRVLIVGGDRARAAGPYDSTLSVLQTGIFQKAGVLRTAIAGFPEGNPNISDTALDEALAAKVNFGRNAGLQLSIVTQFCFQAEPIVDWVRRTGGRGIDVPVRVGLAGPAGLMTLIRYAARCGIGNSLHVLTEHPSFAKLLVDRGPEPIIREIVASSDRANPAILPAGIAGLHFFVFGGFNKTMDWINAALAQ